VHGKRDSIYRNKRHVAQRPRAAELGCTGVEDSVSRERETIGRNDQRGSGGKKEKKTKVPGQKLQANHNMGGRWIFKKEEMRKH